ncbi:NUDIX domain-containing protein [Leuconostoc falkenbergense]|uniref:NUDIX domain-containing protein n=1 Tax=Leuconostoc falkenbergense TaxID=2766470 RepID=UPI0024AD75CB|nr:NUDIX domain-containing protein [Leuconostoc falkenbergense]MDI6666399.1 NUDIX domain-containing protein [Leuconostoc falkenbergense]
MNINVWNNYTTVFANIFTIIALIYAAIQWFQFSIKRTLYKNRKQLLKNTSQFQKLDRSERRDALKGINNYGKKIIQGANYFPADEIDLLSFLLGLNQSLTFCFSKEDLKNLAFGYMRMSNNLKKRMFFGMDSSLIQEQSLFFVQVADLLFLHASLSESPQSKDNFNKRKVTGKSGHTIEYVDFLDDARAYKLSVSWFKEMQTINSKYKLGFDRGSRFPEKYNHQTKQTKINSNRSYDAVLPSLIENNKIPMIKTSVDDRNGQHYLELSLGETTYSSVESLRQKESQLFEINKAITISMIIMAKDGEVLVPTRAKNKGIDSYPGTLTTSVNGNLDIPTRLFGNTDYDTFGLPDFYKAIAREAKEELNLEINTKKIIVHGVVKIFTPLDYGTWVLCMSYQSSRTVEQLEKYIKSNSNLLGNYETSNFKWFSFEELEQEKNTKRMMPHLEATYSLLKEYLGLNS